MRICLVSLRVCSGPQQTRCFPGILALESCDAGCERPVSIIVPIVVIHPQTHSISFSTRRMFARAVPQRRLSRRGAQAPVHDLRTVLNSGTNVYPLRSPHTGRHRRRGPPGMLPVRPSCHCHFTVVCGTQSQSSEMDSYLAVVMAIFRKTYKVMSHSR